MPIAPIPPSEALRYWRKRDVVPREVYEDLTAEAKEKAFSVAGVAKMDVFQQVFEMLDEALASGVSMDDFRKSAISSLGELWGGATPSRLDNIFRTNLIEAYNAGRHETMRRPEIMEDRPYWRFDATHDKRVTEICRECDGVVLPADHPWWQTHYPALHYQCRSIVTPLTEEEAMAHGITSNPPTIQAMPGFGTPPTSVTGGTLRVQQGDYHPDLLRAAKGAT